MVTSLMDTGSQLLATDLTSRDLKVQSRTSSGPRRKAVATSILEAVSLKDVEYLQRLADEINKKYFKGHVTTPVRWGIPSATEQNPPSLDIASLTDEERDSLVRAITFYNTNKFESAKAELAPLVERGQKEATKLYMKVLKRLRDDAWIDLARQINRVCTDTLFVAPGSTEIQDENGASILVHPSLSRSAGLAAPRYVLGYVLFHEQLHSWLGTTADQPHPPTFRKIEATFPDRAKAIRWLALNNFTTIEDSSQ